MTKRSHQTLLKQVKADALKILPCLHTLINCDIICLIVLGNSPLPKTYDFAWNCKSLVDLICCVLNFWELLGHSTVNIGCVSHYRSLVQKVQTNDGKVEANPILLKNELFFWYLPGMAFFCLSFRLQHPVGSPLVKFYHAETTKQGGQTMPQHVSCASQWYNQNNTALIYQIHNMHQSI